MDITNITYITGWVEPGGGIDSDVKDYITRVDGDGGVVEDTSIACINQAVSELKSDGFWDKASLVLVPSGYGTGILYSILPDSGDGDFTVTRASIATRINEDGLIEEMAIDVPRLQY